MTVFSCANCNFRFEAEEAKTCPRCSSTDVVEFVTRRREREGHSVVRADRPGTIPPAGAPRVFREGKEGWRDFHSSQATVCLECGGAEFDLDWKRKEKTCRKCGAVMPLPRRFA